MNKFKLAKTVLTFESELGDDDYYTIIASCHQSQSMDGVNFDEGKRSVKVYDRDPSRGFASAYTAILNVMQAENFDLLDGKDGEGK